MRRTLSLRAKLTLAFLIVAAVPVALLGIWVEKSAVRKEFDSVREKHSLEQKMMRGETGVSRFFSPPMQADMIAGHTAVPDVGWGVMVPQPVAELYDQASNVQFLALTIALGGLAGAGLLGWWLARRISAPLETVRDTLIGVETAATETRIAPLPGSAIREAYRLVEAFNAMAARLDASHVALLEAKAAAGHANRAKSPGQHVARTAHRASRHHQLRRTKRRGSAFARRR